MNKKNKIIFFPLLCFFLSTLVFTPDNLFAATVTVCGSGCDFITIQAGITTALPGDTVLVSDGVYFENITIGKSVTVKSVNGSAVTTINGSNSGNVVFFTSGAGSSAVLEGFSLLNGTNGIFIDSASPVIQRNEIRNNSSHGIYNHTYSFSNPGRTVASQILNNQILANGGSGVCNYGVGNTAMISPTIQENIISGNTHGIYNYGHYRSTISPLIENNLIENNTQYGINNHTNTY